MSWKIIDRLLLPIVFFLSAFVLALTLWQLLIAHRSAEIQAATNEQLVFTKSKIESEWREAILPIERLAERRSARPQQPDAEMKSDAAMLASAGATYYAIEWLDPSLRLRWSVPGNSSDLRASDEFASGSEQSAARDALKRSALSAYPVTMRGGAAGLLVCQPVYSASRLIGYLVAVFRDQDFFSSILRDTTESYSVAVWDGAQLVYGPAVAAEPQDLAWAQNADVHLPQLTLRVQVWPKPGAFSYPLPLLPRVEFIGGILMAGLLAFGVYLAEIYRLRAKKLEREIAGREQAERALAHAQKMEAMGRLAGGVAHDFNNLLMVMQGHAAMLRQGSVSEAAVRAHANEIRKAARRASALTRRLLAFSRKQALQMRVVDLNTLVLHMRELLPPVLGEDIELVIDLDPNIGTVKADVAQMEQVIMNLVFNGRDAMPDGGVLTIRTANSDLDQSWVELHQGVHAGPHVTLMVRDTGQGMDQSVLSHIFEPFFTTKDSSQGTGLGLSTVYGTVRQSGGCITVSSKVGQGTTFEIHLPRVEEPAEAELPVEELGSASGAGTILVVEDDSSVRRITREFLKISGYTVIEAGDAENAIQLMKLHKESIDLVLTDVLMPGMKGRELVERLAEMRAGIKVLYMSAYTEDAAINIGVLKPGTEFIEKPFSPEELAVKVRKILAH
jgi:signal transduction histidine kinase/CheY-like chemotaxis protein